MELDLRINETIATFAQKHEVLVTGAVALEQKYGYKYPPRVGVDNLDLLTDEPRKLALRIYTTVPSDMVEKHYPTRFTLTTPSVIMDIIGARDQLSLHLSGLGATTADVVAIPYLDLADQRRDNKFSLSIINSNILMANHKIEPVLERDHRVAARMAWETTLRSKNRSRVKIKYTYDEWLWMFKKLLQVDDQPNVSVDTFTRINSLFYDNLKHMHPLFFIQLAKFALVRNIGYKWN